ncbi:MAG: lipoate--protein ligase family protein [Candidatus Izimaplasma sp.]|nr:lipoate--protein ligase family protein [Candidatus Izimaplasma bacterium]
MISLKNSNTDPYFNLAFEEYVLKHLKTEEDVFYLWRNKKSVIIGRNQSPYNEVNLKYAHENNIPLIRRCSGGGAVYHDLGNINFTHITKHTKKYLNNYAYFLTPIISVLNNLGINAKFVEKSHVYVEDKKISGNAQSFYKDKMIHHGTILYNIDTENAKNVLSRNRRFKGKAVDSKRSEIINIKPLIKLDTTIESFMEYFLNELLMHDTSRLVKLTDHDYQKIENLKENKYQTVKWNYGKTNNITVKTDRFSMTIKKGVIDKTSILPSLLKGEECTYENLSNVLKEHKLKEEILTELFASQ